MRRRAICFVLAVLLIFPIIAGCNGCFGRTVYDNEVDPLVISTGDLDGVFNPFFSTSGADMGVIGLTQLGMMEVNESGNVVCGPEIPSIAYAFSETLTGANLSDDEKKDPELYYTTYRFVIKNDIKFSDGELLTIDDVLFNFYVYLDPIYTGSTTMYSTDIYGLKEYRAQSTDPNAAAGAEEKFQTDGQRRIDNLIFYASKAPLMPADLEQIEKEDGDLDVFKRLYKDDLYVRWTLAAGMIESYQEEFPGMIDATWQVFLINEGFINPVPYPHDNTKYYIPEDYDGFSGFGDGLTEEQAKEKAVSMVFDYTLGSQIEAGSDEFLQNLLYFLYTRQASDDALNYFIADERTKHIEELIEENGGELPVPEIVGISVIPNQTSFVGKQSNAASQNTEFNLGSPHNVLQIRVNGVDPKALINFSITIAPKKYYGAGEHAHANQFGVESSIDFMFNTVRAQRVPIGAGPYMASNSQNTENRTDVNKFFENGVVYYIRNEHFTVPNKPLIRLVRMKVIKTTQLYDSLKKGDIHFADPEAKASTIELIDADNRAGHSIGKMELDNLGYGYVGINARYVKDINIRRAIMHAINAQLSVEYYTSTMASRVYRSMSKVNEIYYPFNVTEDRYPYDPTGEEYIRGLIEDSGYEKNTSGILEKGGDKLEFAFTIAGDSDDHPMFAAFDAAAILLNSFGFKITVSKDPNALRKLASGLLEVWAAAWGSTIDPDLYQVYHMDSKATSVLNWGYKYMLDGNNETEKDLIRDLAKKIEEGRETTVVSERRTAYHEALDLIMELAIEMPTYQRKNLYAFRSDIVDETTLFQGATAFKGPLSEIWSISLITE